MSLVSHPQKGFFHVFCAGFFQNVTFNFLIFLKLFFCTILEYFEKSIFSFMKAGTTCISKSYQEL